ncbi:MAG: DUF4097 domain-containing protein [Bacteroidetes bacterium]|nr:DUF4097 domain-containing protein [Bacteroidota bacterium]
MKQIIKVLVGFLILFSAVTAGERKDYHKVFSVNEGQDIRIKSVSGMNVKVISWDKKEIEFNLSIDISSSDKDYEEDYIQNFNISETKRNSEILITMDEPESGGWSILDIFRLRFHFYVDKEIRGTIYVPRSNGFTADFRYSEIKLDGIEGELNLPGRSNEIYLENCININEVQNSYGNTEILNSGGKLKLESRSAELSIKNFKGSARIEAYYMDKLEVKNITGALSIDGRSGNVNVEDAGANLKVISPYSEIFIKNINGKAEIENRSGTTIIDKSSGLTMDGPYCTMEASNIVVNANEKIYVNGRSGAIKIQNITGDLVIDDAYSSISLKKIKGNVKLASRSENIIVDGLVGDIDFETQYCSISMMNISSQYIEMTNRSNPIELKLITNPEKVEIKNEYGKVDATFPKNFNGYFELEASHGDIVTELPLRIRDHGSSVSAHGQVGIGGGNVTIETRSDDIIIHNK